MNKQNELKLVKLCNCILIKHCKTIHLFLCKGVGCKMLK